jgi:hypothetical protein
MNIYNVNKYHPAWAWYIDYKDIEFISAGKKPTKEQLADLKKRAVDDWMKHRGLTPEAVAARFKERTEKKIVHPLFGTD